MADTFKVLAQLNPSAATATTLYTVPRREGTGVNTQFPAQTTISSLVVCNRDASTADTATTAAAAATGQSSLKKCLKDTNL